jgi:hypothetical protein
MKRLIITEEDNRHIKGLYETIGVKLGQEQLNSPKAQNTKKFATALNTYYKIKLGAATTGQWTDKDYNDTLKRFMDEKKIPVWVCKKGDGYCHDEDEGQITAGANDVRRLYDEISKISSVQENPNESWLTFPGDKNYQYQKQNNKWVAKNIKTGQIVDLSKYPTTIQKLEKQFPGGKSPKPLQ